MTALGRREPDRVPVCEFTVNDFVIHQIRETCSYEDFIDMVDLDAVAVRQPLASKAKLSENTYVDGWKTQYTDTGEHALIETVFPISSKEEFLTFRPPDPRQDARLIQLRRLVRRFKSKRAIVFTISDSFSRPRKLMGMEALLTAYAEPPDFLQDLIDMTVEYQMRLLELAIAEGAEVIFSADDYAGNFGPIMSPRHFEKYVLPGLLRVVRRTHELGALYIKHSDGNLWPILEMILDTGIDGLNPIDPSAGMDIVEVKKRFGDRVCLIGNVDCRHTLCSATREEVEEEVKYLIANIAPGGGYILSSSNSIHSGVNPSNFLAMIRAARKYGNYPLPRSTGQWESR